MNLLQNYTEIYTKKDFSLLKKVLGKPNFNAYQVISTNLHSHFISDVLIKGEEKSANIEIYTLIEDFVMRVWQQSLKDTIKQFPDYIDHKWVEENRHPIKRLVFTSKKREDAENYFFNKIIDLCNSGKIKVSDGISIDKKNITVILNEGIITESMERNVLDQLKGEVEHYKFEKRDVSYRYLEIMNYITYFDSHLLELLNMDESVKQVSELDKKFLQTAEFCNLSAALHYLEQGANINAINEYGDTVISLAAQCASDSYHNNFVSEDPASLAWNTNRYLINANENAIEFIDTMLGMGADINMYGSNGSSALMYSAYVGNYVLIKYLLEHGANPNLPLDPYEEYDWMYSKVLQEVYDSECGIGMSEKEVYKEMEKLFLDKGAR